MPPLMPRSTVLFSRGLKESKPNLESRFLEDFFIVISLQCLKTKKPKTQSVLLCTADIVNERMV
jgi:hypothetical protein